MALGQHRGQHELGRYTGVGRRRDLRDDLAGDPVGHLIADTGIQLRCAGKELACQLGLVGRRPDNCSDDAHHANGGGIGGGGVSLGRVR